MGLIEEALAKQAGRGEPKRIDYERMQREHPKQKAALTRAVKTGDAEKVAAVIKQAIVVWNEIGAWPDDWSTWQRALDDLLPWYQHVSIDEL